MTLVFADKIHNSKSFQQNGLRPYIEKLASFRDDGQLQVIHTPWRLCEDTLQKVSEFINLKNSNILVLFNLEFLYVLLVVFEVNPSRITFAADSKTKLNAAEGLGCKVLNVTYSKKTGAIIMPQPKKKFDFVVMNPPYQSSTKEGKQRGSRTHIWDKFVELSLQLVKENGLVCNVHPSGWRRGDSKFSGVGELLRNKQMLYLLLGNVDSGTKTFQVTTGFDWYILRNCSVTQPTEIIDCDGITTTLDLQQIEALPDSQIEKITALMAKENEPKVDFLFDRSAYGHDKLWVRKEKGGKFKHPVVYSLPQKGHQIWWSSTNKKGHFGASKIIWSNGAATQILIDKKGEYGMTEWAYAIVDKPSNLPLIKQAMESDEFLNLCKSIQFSYDRYDPKFISLFRKDFWKEFI